MPTSPRKPRRWYRWITQFSLRTLLIVVTLSAVVCWWFLQPKTQYEQLSGERLKLRRQVRPVTQADKAVNPFAGELVNAGMWRLYDQFDGLIADGRYEQDQPHGKWTLYHPNGRKAAEGVMTRGLRTGLWKVWNADGQRVSEVTYAIGVATPRVPPESRPWGCYSLVPVVGMVNFLAPTGPVAWQGFGGGGFGSGMMGGGSFGPGMVQPTTLYRWRYTRQPESIRHGPCRAWHATGQLWFEGQYESDLRTGLWKYYDEQGRLIESGTFESDRREGAWEVAGADGVLHAVEYFADRPRDEFERQLAMIRDDLASGAVRRELAAVSRLEELGRHGVPLLVEMLQSKSHRLKFLAVRTLARQSAVPDEAIPKIAKLIDDPDSRLALRAKLVVYLADPAQRPQLLTPLLEATKAEDDELAFEALAAIYRAGGSRRELVLKALLERMGREPEKYYFYGLYSNPIAQFGDLGEEVLAQLDRIFPALTPDARLAAVFVLQHIVLLRGEPQNIELPSGVIEQHWEIPAAAQPLLQQAKADPDPRVQEAAALVGQATGGFGSHGFAGPAGGFF
ncbi:MAG TPA: hypothetical protein VFV87_21930 [Pirellulaceae bacterium]|nr:hypothetical protein [Pirellulaceae bacterium]